MENKNHVTINYNNGKYTDELKDGIKEGKGVVFLEQ